VKTWSLDSFKGGLDLRDGLFSEAQQRFRELSNFYVDKGGKIVRRCPCSRLDVLLDSDCQGLITIDGADYTFAKKGDTVSHSGGDAGDVTTLYFDNPDLCTSWELVAAGNFQGYAAAWIRHTFPSTAYPTLLYLHLWDGLVFAPTYVQDPELPGSFSPSITDLADQEYDDEFVPVLGFGASKAWTSTLRGNTQASRTADARYWNQREASDFLQNGEEYCFVVPEGAGTTRSFIVPVDHASLGIDGRWAYYVLERAVDGAWEPMEEVAIAPVVNYTWRPVATASRFAGGWDEITIQVRWGSASAGLVRFRLVPGDTSVQIVTQPTVTAQAASGADWTLTVTQATYRHRGGDLTTRAGHTHTIQNNKTYLLGVAAGGKTEVVDISSTFPNGWEREYRRFYKRISFVAALASGQTAVNSEWATYTAQTGTVSTTAASNAVVGVGTTFTTQLSIGSVIRVNGELQTVATIVDNLNLTTVAVFAATNAGVAWDKQISHYAKYISGETYVKVNAAAIAGLAALDSITINGTAFTVISITADGIALIRKNNGVGGADAGDWTATVDGLYAISRALTIRIADYQYAFQLNENSEWYTGVVIDYTDRAGAEDAVTLASAAHDDTGGRVTAIAAVRNRMAICYAASMQLWAIDQATSATAYLDQLPFGTGDQETPSPVPFYGSLVIPIQTGFRSISVVGANTDNLQDLNIGEPIAPRPMVTVRAAAFWPWHGQLVIAGTRSGALVFLCLDYSKESKITAWSEWTVAGLTDVDPGTMIVDGSKLRFRSGSRIYEFDHQATVFRDFGDTEGAAYESAALWHYNDMGDPGRQKRFLALDLVQDGTSSIAFRLPPYGSSGYETSGPSLPGPTYTGTSYGRLRLPMACHGTAIAPRLTTRSETGYRLQRLALDFVPLRR
jgi:hypothetical protein